MDNGVMTIEKLTQDSFYFLCFGLLYFGRRGGGSGMGDVLLVFDYFVVTVVGVFVVALCLYSNY